MIPTFTGNSRRPRQVNLSGRNPNPFAKFGTPQGSQNAVANAQQDRLARQQERERLQAVKVIQKTWRGASLRESIRCARRLEWDAAESEGTNGVGSGDSHYTPYASDSEALSQLRSILRFFKIAVQGDLARLQHFHRRLTLALAGGNFSCTGEVWSPFYSRLENLCLDALERERTTAQRVELLEILSFLTEVNTTSVALHPVKYYSVLSNVVRNTGISLEVIVTPLQSTTQANTNYEAFAFQFLTTPRLDVHLGSCGGLQALADHVDCTKLAKAITAGLRAPEHAAVSIKHTDLLTKFHAPEGRLWLLAHLIYFYRSPSKAVTNADCSTDEDYVFGVSNLLSSLAEFIEIEPGSNNGDEDYPDEISRSLITPPTFVQAQIESLVNQESMSALLVQMNVNSSNGLSAGNTNTDQSRILATYILTLFRMFPRRGDEIRMWLYLGLSSTNQNTTAKQGVPIVRYFWQATQRSHIFGDITHNPRAAVPLLKMQSMPLVGNSSLSTSSGDSTVNDEWRIILLFVELYVFVLKVMDDEEFFSSGKPAQSGQLDSLGRRNALPLDDIRALVTFLKHLGFAMYYDAAEIMASVDPPSRRDIGTVFQPANAQSTIDNTFKASDSNHIAGLQGMSLDYVKGTVTGLLRAIYERDSRRNFLPPGHWLMTSRFDMTNFIDSVVEEEERRHEEQEEGDETMDDEPETPWTSRGSSGLVGTSHTQRIRRLEQLQRQQRAIAHRRHLQAVAPRLEILQNMPFLIPFETRVKIFRRFVDMDQIKRRGGHLDPELWRLSRLHGSDPFRGGLERHGAKIRRGYEFDDAYDAFFSLGAALKEPISITFVDQFDTPEAGIDGGGVTKEFLTSVTSQAFAPAEGINLFVENENHFLYPNPSAVEEQKEWLREAGFTTEMPTFREVVSNLLQRYEFLGRIIGKCLYEGILVDIGFAGFFLLKWALTGGAGVAPRESAYRANLNDLRDFDEGLYQGLVCSFSADKMRQR